MYNVTEVWVTKFTYTRIHFLLVKATYRLLVYMQFRKYLL